MTKLCIKNIAAFFLIAAAIASYSFFFSSKAMASTCNGNVNISTISDLGNVKAGDEIDILVNNPDPKGFYEYDLYIYGWADGQPQDSGTAYLKGSGNLDGFADQRFHSIYMTDPGNKKIYINYNQYPTLDDLNNGTNACATNRNSNSLTLIVTAGSNFNNSPVGSATISLPSQIKKGDTATISYSISGAKDKNAHIYIDDNDKTPAGISISSDNFSGSYQWDTSGTSVDSHEIKIKVYTTDGTYADITKAVNTTVCTTCSTSTNTTDDSPLSGPDSTIGTTDIDPNTISLNNSGSGVGTLAEKILKILAEIIGALAFIGILVGGIQYITAGPNEAQSAKAKKTLIYSIIGEVLAIAAYYLFSVIRLVLQS